MSKPESRRGKVSPRAGLYQALYDRGLTCSEIAREAGVSVSAIAQWLRARGLPPRGTGNVPDDTRPVLPEGMDARVPPSAPGYLVTADGEVYSTRTDPPCAMVRNAARTSPRVALSVNGRLAYRYVAGLVLEAFAGPRPEGATIGHRDGDPANCRLGNLYWRLGVARIDPAEFVRAYQTSGSAKEAAERLGLAPSAVYQTANRLRAMGVPLKVFREKITSDRLQELIHLADEAKEEKG